MFSLHCGIFCIFRLYFLKHFTFIFKCWGFSSFDYVYALCMENNIFILYDLSVQFFHYQWFCFCFCFFLSFTHFIIKIKVCWWNNLSLTLVFYLLRYVLLSTITYIGKNWPNLKVCGTLLWMSKASTSYAIVWICFFRMDLFALIYSDEFL